MPHERPPASHTPPEALTQSGEFRMRVGLLEERTRDVETGLRAMTNRTVEELIQLRETMSEDLGELRADVARLHGRLTGLMAAAGVLGAVVAVLAQAVLSILTRR